MLNGATPLFAAVVASIVARRPPERPVLIGLAVGFAGAVAMAAPAIGEGRDSTGGIVLIVMALASYGVAINLARPLQMRNGALPTMWRALFVALVLTAPLGLPALLEARWTTRSLLSMLALGALGTAVAIVVAAIAAGRMGATRASATAFLIPVVALVLGVVVRGERVVLLSALGAAVCLAGAWIIRYAQQRHV
jgi:drug/metabolite transporter (DMT)-like permease